MSRSFRYNDSDPIDSDPIVERALSGRDKSIGQLAGRSAQEDAGVLQKLLSVLGPEADSAIDPEWAMQALESLKDTSAGDVASWLLNLPTTVDGIVADSIVDIPRKWGQRVGAEQGSRPGMGVVEAIGRAGAQYPIEALLDSSMAYGPVKSMGRKGVELAMAPTGLVRESGSAGTNLARLVGDEVGTVGSRRLFTHSFGGANESLQALAAQAKSSGRSPVEVFSELNDFFTQNPERMNEFIINMKKNPEGTAQELINYVGKGGQAPAPAKVVTSTPRPTSPIVPDPNPTEVPPWDKYAAAPKRGQERLDFTPKSEEGVTNTSAAPTLTEAEQPQLPFMDYSIDTTGGPLRTELSEGLERQQRRMDWIPNRPGGRQSLELAPDVRTPEGPVFQTEATNLKTGEQIPEHEFEYFPFTRERPENWNLKNSLPEWKQHTATAQADNMLDKAGFVETEDPLTGARNYPPAVNPEDLPEEVLADTAKYGRNSTIQQRNRVNRHMEQVIGEPPVYPDDLEGLGPKGFGSADQDWERFTALQEGRSLEGPVTPSRYYEIGEPTTEQAVQKQWADMLAKEEDHVEWLQQLAKESGSDEYSDSIAYLEKLHDDLQNAIDGEMSVDDFKALRAEQPKRTAPYKGPISPDELMRKEIQKFHTESERKVFPADTAKREKLNMNPDVGHYTPTADFMASEVGEGSPADLAKKQFAYDNPGRAYDPYAGEYAAPQAVKAPTPPRAPDDTWRAIKKTIQNNSEVQNRYLWARKEALSGKGTGQQETFYKEIRKLYGQEGEDLARKNSDLLTSRPLSALASNEPKAYTSKAPDTSAAKAIDMRRKFQFESRKHARKAINP